MGDIELSEAICINCGCQFEECQCSCPFCGETTKCDCCIGMHLATGG